MEEYFIIMIAVHLLENLKISSHEDSGFSKEM
jgi:hypothetical protein